MTQGSAGGDASWLPGCDEEPTSAKAGPRLGAWRVAVVAPIPGPLTYLCPEALGPDLPLGLRVRVPMAGRQVTAFVLGKDSNPPKSAKLKPIASRLEDTPLLTAEILELGAWLARHYGGPPGEALAALVPAAVRKGTASRGHAALVLRDEAAAQAEVQAATERGKFRPRDRVLRALLAAPAGPSGLPTIIRRDLLRTAEVSASPLQTLQRDGLIARTELPADETDLASQALPERAQRPEPTPEQRLIIDELLPRVGTDAPRGVLLHGVTGSGKTEVYLRLIERALEQGRGAVMLVPEIALTPQTVERLRARLGQVAVLHSGLSDGDRAKQWRLLAKGRLRVAVGPRSALFAPIEALGVIILDEEHETTFKQAQTPRYHARDAALERGRLSGAIVVLGSATPSLEAEGFATLGRIDRMVMKERVASRPMPEVRLVDMRKEKPIGPGGILSRPLVQAMEKTLAEGEQVLLFLNRRGFATMVACKACGWTAQCESCEVPLTHYRRSERLLCHWCGHEEIPRRICPDCSREGLAFTGFGTERVCAAVESLFPEARVSRMDSETLRARGAPERMFHALRSGEIDVLVGTQSLAKGFDVPAITLVGVISADTALGLPDFRAAERTFQLLCQVAGRAGRGERPGLVLIQSYLPDHTAIRRAAHHDHDRFVAEELAIRKAHGYPPYGHLARLVLEGEDAEKTAQAAKELAEAITPLLGTEEGSDASEGAVRLLGPAPCPLEKLKDRWRWHVLLIAERAERLTELLPQLPRRATGGVKILLDRDPVALL